MSDINLMVAIPSALLLIGTILKRTEKISNKTIPLILLPIGVILSIWAYGFSPESFIQGIVFSTSAVGLNSTTKHTGECIKYRQKS